MNLARTIVACLLLVMGSSCHRGATQDSADRSADVSTEDAENASSATSDMATSELSETVIYGKVMERWVDEIHSEAKDHPCNTHPCEAKVEVVALQQAGSDYRGQFDDGAVIQVHFSYTLDPTEELFPELNRPLSGLVEGDYFKASIHTSTTADSPDRYRVDQYEK